MTREQLFTNSIEVSVDQLIYSQGFNKHKPAGERIVTMAEEAAAKTARLIEPAFTFRRLPVDHVDYLTVNAGELQLNIGAYSYLLEPAVEMVVYLTTIGSKLDQEVEALNQAGKFAEAYWLNCAGILALHYVFKNVRDLTEKAAHAADHGVGLDISPGTLIGWRLADQKKLCSILDYRSLGISITSAATLIPYKTSSGVIGIGPGYTATKVEPACKYCTSANSCWMSRIKKRAKKASLAQAF